MSIACVIINYNDSKRVSLLTTKLYNYNVFSNIVIVDNNSRIEERSFLQTNLKENDVIHICYNNENFGYCKGTNVGFKYLLDKNCEYVFSINSDIDVDSNTLLELVKFLETNKDYGACSCKMIEYGKEKNAYYYFPNIHDENMQYLGLRKIFKSHVKPNKIHNCYIDVDFVRSSLCCFNYEYLEKVNFFDENLFLYYCEATTAKKFLDNNLKEAVLLNYTYQHNHIYSKTKINLMKIGYKDKVYTFNNYFPKNKINMLRLKICYKLGVFIRKIFRFK